MAKIFRLTEVEARKRALVAESEVYRQLLTLEVQNIRLYNARTRRKFALLRMANPLLLAAGSLFGWRFRGTGMLKKKRRGKLRKLAGASVLGWRLYRQFGPTLKRALFRRFSRQDPSEAEVPAANI